MIWNAPYLRKMGNAPYHVLVAKRARRPYRRAEQTREHVLGVAERLFHADGIRAVGVDRLAQDAKVTTATLYRLFGSKEGLVAAYLRRQDQGWFDWLERTAARDGLAHFFDELDEQARQADYRGCPFRMALAEYPAPNSQVHRIAVQNKLRTRARFRELAAEAGAPNPDTVAEQLVLLMDGICASAAERNPDSQPGAGPQLARALLNAG
jgi:AcrR family transcriptional regulator